MEQNLDFEKVETGNKREFDVFSVQWLENDIIHVHSKGDAPITLPLFKNLVRNIGEMTCGQKAPILCTADEFTTPDEEVRKFMVNPDSNPYSLATAFVVHSLPQKLIANFFMKVLRPKRLIKTFSTVEEAVAWLRIMACDNR